jgi:hypothetical protein
VHVDRDDRSAKFWLDPVALAGNLGFGPVELRRSTAWWRRIAFYCWRNGMNASHLNSGEPVRDVHVTEDTLAVDLADGRTIIVPLTWYPRLLNATMEQRSRWQVSGAGYGIYWPEIDEDLSTEGLLRGAPAAAEPARLGR